MICNHSNQQIYNLFYNVINEIILSKMSQNNLTTKLKPKDILDLNETLQTNIHKEKVYWMRNDAKLRAVYSAQNYEEFRDIVDAAHLTPLDKKKDKINGADAKTVWNSIAPNSNMQN